MKRRRVIWFACAALLAAVVATIPMLKEWLTVDACLDGGGAWIEQTGKCSHDQAEIDRYRPADR